MVKNVLEFFGFFFLRMQNKSDPSISQKKKQFFKIQRANHADYEQWSLLYQRTQMRLDRATSFGP